MAMVAAKMSGHLQNQLTRSLERLIEEAYLSGELKLTGRKLKDFPNTGGKYNLSDTVIADLSKNRFGELPVEVTEFYFLERLQLYHNTIRSIPDSVVYLQSLIYLDLSRNQLSVLPSTLCQLPLEVLLVANNKLVALPEELGRMKTLAELDASCNEISHLPPQLGELPVLKSLGVRRNHLVELPIEITYLRLVKLDISGNRISTLPVELRTMTTLVDLNLSHNPLTSPPSYLCTRGRVHVFKYLEIQAVKEDKKRGILSEELRRAHRKAGHLSDLRFANGISAELRQKRYTVDSGYSTSDGMDKRWSQEIGKVEDDEIGRVKGQWTHQESAPIPVKHPPDIHTNGNCSGASTPSTISPGENTNLEDELSKAIILHEHLERKHLERKNSDKEDYIKLSNAIDGIRPTHGSPRFPSNSVNKVMANGTGLSPTAELAMNGNGLVPNQEDKRPLEHIQTYREYKEALRQQRAHDGVYRPRMSGDGAQQTMSVSSELLKQDGSSGSSYTNQPQALINHTNHDILQNSSESPVLQNRIETQTNSKQIFDDGVHKRPVQKVIPSRNCSAVTFQASASSLVNGSRLDYGEKNGAVTSGLHDGGCYIKPSSPIKTPTSLAHLPGSTGILSPKLVTASVGYVHSPVPVTANGSQHRPSTLGQPGTRSPKIGTSRGITWNRDVPPEKLSFTMRREFDKAREEAELIEQLRSHIETRLKMSLPDDMAPALTDGVVLCHLANHVRPRSVASIHVPSPAVPKLTMARCRRNVDNFLEACRKIGVEEGLICCASDVLEGRGLVQVAITVAELLKFHQPRSPAHIIP
ncbi:leucine-rich repeat and calponin homology domain-containing protein 1 isoform X3 [Zootermopsis nevadensis]|uniref:leucine-rich repeat and calponin homology domain-containing protein 1 isoform X3 n=1 Tax=Zootermopsis nevadensis TaxID=136037 RepID=UPI000B8ED443|nr:leucine-rich repeat and calponin homology domain-containing protein 1 isoform X3 [Zootermopsis nevadensis]